jgi:hypothetical protein
MRELPQRAPPGPGKQRCASTNRKARQQRLSPAALAEPPARQMENRPLSAEDLRQP